MDREQAVGRVGGQTAAPSAQTEAPGKRTLTQGLVGSAGGGGDTEEGAPAAAKLERFDASKVKPAPPERDLAPPARGKQAKPTGATTGKQKPASKHAHADADDAHADAADAKDGAHPLDAAHAGANAKSGALAKAGAQAQHHAAKPAAAHTAGGEGGPSARDHSVGGEGGPSASDHTVGGEGGASTKPGYLGKLKGAPGKGEITSTVAKPAPGDPSLSRTTVAVGEEVTLAASSDGKWTASTADGATSAQGSDFHWKAPKRPTNATVTFEPTKGDKQTKTFTVIAPSAVNFKKLRDDPQPPAGVGMWTNLEFGPTNVNFYEVQWLEIGDDASGLGGYFKQLRLQDGRWLTHDPITKGTPMGEDNKGVDDHAFINTLPPLHRDDGDIWGWRQYFAGKFHWEVPNHYKVGTETGDGVKFAQVQQKFSMDDAGNVTVTKGAASATQALTGEVLGDAKLVKLKDVTFAARWIAGEGRQGNAVAQAKWALDRVSAYRANDPESYKNLIAAIAQLQVQIYVAVRCTNTYSYFTRDTVSVSMTGTQRWDSGNFDLNDGKKGAMRDFNVNLASVINAGSFNTGTSVKYHVTAEGHEFDYSVGQPFDAVNQQNMPGSEGRYVLTTHWK